MHFITFKDLNLSSEELRDIIEFIAKKRNFNSYKDKSDAELLFALKEKSRNLAPKKPLKNSKRKITENLTPKKPLKNLKRKISKNLTPKKPLKNLKRKITENLTLKKSLKNVKSKKSKILTLKKSLENLKRESNQFLASKNKERIDIIREFLKDLSYKLSKSELKEIKTNLYNIEKRKQFNLKRTNKYLGELDKKILELDRYDQDYDDYEYKGVRNVRDLFELSVNEDYYKPKLTKSGYDNKYTQYESKGDRILSIQEYLSL